MTDLNLTIDKEKCIHCAQCIKDCIGCVLEFDENKIPKVKDGAQNCCIKCQHCLAVCPSGALSIFNKNPQNSEEKRHINPEDVLNLIKNRRSFRQFKNENIEPETLEKLKDMLNYVPTGCNARAFHFDFVDVEPYRQYCIKKLKNLTWLLPKKFAYYKDAILSGEDVIFRGAAQMLVVSIDKKAPCKDIDPIIALSYFELYAQSLGVGTLWCGFAKMALTMFKKLEKMLNIKKGYKISYVMLFGTPAVKYHRAIQPDTYFQGCS